MGSNCNGHFFFERERGRASFIEPCLLGGEWLLLVWERKSNTDCECGGKKCANVCVCVSVPVFVNSVYLGL